MTDSLPLLGIIIIAIIGFFNMIGSLFKQSSQAYHAQFRLSWKILLVRFGLIGMVLFILVVLIFKFNLPNYSDFPLLSDKLNTNTNTAGLMALPQREAKSTTDVEIESTQQPVNVKTTAKKKKGFKAGDTYIKNGVSFVLVDKEKYQKNNISHFPTEVIDGVEYYLTRRDRSRPRS